MKLNGEYYSQSEFKQSTVLQNITDRKKSNLRSFKF